MVICVIFLYIGLGVIAAVLITSLVCFFMAFYAIRKKGKKEPEFSLPPGVIYEPFSEQMLAFMKETQVMPHREVSIVSHDGLKLYGKYYEYKKGAPIELLFHGYRGKAERDLCGGVQRCFSLGRSALIVDQRACGKSEGHIISFGVNESRDLELWVRYIIRHIDVNAKIILCGISMGASTVLMAANRDLPKNVIGILADCGFSSAKEIIKKVIRVEKGLPANILYPFVRLGALLFGRFNLEENPPIKAVTESRLPIIFIHGDTDDFVPADMSREMYDACSSEKTLLMVKGAGHGLSYLVDPDAYLKTIVDFSPNMNLKTELKK